MSTSDPTSPRRLAAARAGRQHGVASHAQLVAAGLSRHELAGMVARGEWTRPVRGVYVVAGAPDTNLQRLWIASLAVTAAGGAVSHVSAAALHGLLRASPLPHVTVPRSASARCPVAKVHRGSLDGPCTQRVDGVRVTTASRTIADCAAILDRPTLEELVDAAFCRHLATAASTIEAARAAGVKRRGNELLASVVEVWTPRIEPGSVAEVRFLRQLAELGVDGIETQYEVRDAAGGFVARLDVAVPARRRAFEYDGVEFHGPRRWAADESRTARLEALGWRVDRVDKVDLLPGADRLRSLVEPLLDARLAG